MPRIEFLIVTTPSQLAFETVKKQALLLQELKIPIVGIVENMKMTSAKMVKQKTEELGIKFLAEIPYDSAIETAIGQSDALLATELGRKVLKIAQTV